MSIPVPEPRIARFERLAYGLFLYWGLYSQLGRGEWAMHSDKIPKEQYARLKDTFTAADFDAHRIARFAREAGMRYITLTTRHHEGFSLYDTRGIPADPVASAEKEVSATEDIALLTTEQQLAVTKRKILLSGLPDHSFDEWVSVVKLKLDGDPDQDISRVIGGADIFPNLPK